MHPERYVMAGLSISIGLGRLKGNSKRAAIRSEGNIRLGTARVWIWRFRTGKSDAVKNIRKCLKAGWRVVSLYTGSQRNYGKVIFSELTKDEKQHVRAGEVYL